MLEIIANLQRDSGAHFFLRFARGTGDVRRGDHIRQTDERGILRRFFRESVQSGTCEMARAQRFSQCRFVNQFAASAIDKPGSFLHFGYRGRIDYFFGRGADGCVQRYHVRVLQQIVQRHEFHFEFARSCRRNVRVVGEHLHFKGPSALGDFRPDAAEANEAEGLSAQLRA